MAALMTFITILVFGRHVGLVGGQKTGRCPDPLPLPENFTCPSEVDCHADNNCDGDLKCCDDSCGNSRCLKPIPDVQETNCEERCPSTQALGFIPPGCRKIITTFCYKYNYTRCCVHENNCNPHTAVLISMTRCHRELCLGHKCAQQGSQCEVDRRRNLPVCVCKQSCPSKVVPVCGDDGYTYENKCFLDKKACENNKKIKILHSGICFLLTIKPDIKDIDNKPEIVGPNGVIEAGDAVNLVCKSAAKQSKLKWFKRIGGKQLAMPESMVAFKTANKATLRIQKTVLAHSGRYVCQNNVDGKAYSSEITLQVSVKEPYSVICRQQKDVGSCNGAFNNYYYDVKDDTCKQFKYGGCDGNNNNFEQRNDCEKRCKGTRFGCTNSMRKVSCSKEVKHDCSDDKECQGRLSCCFNGCSKICFNASSPVPVDFLSTTTQVPTKGPTVTNSRKQIFTKRPTKCGRQICRFYAVCKVNDKGSKECMCPNYCDFTNIRPVCGTDKETGIQKNYTSECFLKIAACRLQKEIIMSDGYCDSRGNLEKPIDLCKLRRCPRHGFCAINPFTGLPHCVCPRFCNFNPKILCASDGRTYLNECIMRAMSCRKDFYIKKINDGPCKD